MGLPYFSDQNPKPYIPILQQVNLSSLKSNPAEAGEKQPAEPAGCHRGELRASQNRGHSA